MSDLVHGIEMLEITGGLRPITTVRASVIGIIGTAPESAMEVNKPYLVTNPLKARQLIFDDVDGQGDDGGTLLKGVDGIYAFCNAVIVMIRVEEGEDEDETATNVAGSPSAKTGAYGFLNAESITGVMPRILLAPGIRQFPIEVDGEDETVTINGVPTALLGAAARLMGIVIIEGPDTTMEQAMEAEALVTGARDRAYFVDPNLEINGNALYGNSGFVAGLIALSDNERGYHYSPSNRSMRGITGTSRPIDFVLGDPACEADILNGAHINTIIRHDGFRLWGNRSLDKTDPLKKFIQTRRISDQLMLSIQRSMFWAIDQNIGRNLFSTVLDSVNAYMRFQKAQGIIYGGRCIMNPDLNTPSELSNGHSYYDFDYSAVVPNERMTFRAHAVNEYIEEVLVVD